MKKICITKNTEAITDLKAVLLSCVPVIQDAHVEWKKAPFYDESFSISQMLNNFEEAKRKYHREIVKEELKPNSKLRVDEAQAMKLFPLEVSPALSNAITQAKNILDHHGLKPEYFVVKAGKVAVNASEVKAFADENTLYAETPKEIEFYNIEMDILNAIERKNRFIEENQIGVIFSSKRRPIIIERWFDWDGEKLLILEGVFRRVKKILAKKEAEEKKK